MHRLVTVIELLYFVKFQRHLSPVLPDAIIERIFAWCVQLSASKQGGFTVNGLAAFLSSLFKGSLTDKSTTLVSLASTTQEVSGPRFSDVSTFVTERVPSFVEYVGT